MDEPKFDLALNAELQNGLVLLSHRRNARGNLVQPFGAATVCEFEPALEMGRVMQFGSDHGYRNKRAERFCYMSVKALDPKKPM